MAPERSEGHRFSFKRLPVAAAVFRGAARVGGVEVALLELEPALKAGQLGQIPRLAP